MNLPQFLLLDELINKCYKRARWIIWQRKSSFLKCFSAIRLIWAHHNCLYLTETIGIGTKKNVSKTRGIAESKYTFNRVSFYSVPQTCSIAPSCWSRAVKSYHMSPLTVAYPHILLLYHILIYSFFKSLKSTEFLNLEEIFDSSYVLLAYTLKARKYHYYLHHKHL